MSPSINADTHHDDRFENLRQELRRGSLPLAVLAALRTEHYGYTLRKTLADHGMAIDEGTLYPLLRRLETQGLAGQPVARRRQAQQTFLPSLSRRQVDSQTVVDRVEKYPHVAGRYFLGERI